MIRRSLPRKSTAPNRTGRFWGIRCIMVMGIGLGGMGWGAWAAQPPTGATSPTESTPPPTSSESGNKTATGAVDGWIRTQINDEQIPESSGLAPSSVPGIFWTHNDSGGQSRLFAVSPDRGTLGHVNLVGVSAIDWEDVATYISDGHRWIIAADCGDNQSNRSFITLYRFREPEMLKKWGQAKSPESTPSIEIAANQIDRIEVAYIDGPRDCEAMAIDVKRRKIVLITKSFLPMVGVYEVELSPESSGASASAAVSTRYRAERVATLPIPLITAADWNPTTDHLVMTNYFQAFFFRAGPTPQSRWSQVPEVLDLPSLKQVEACALAGDGALWITSEGVPMPIATLPPSHFTPESKESHE